MLAVIAEYAGGIDVLNLTDDALREGVDPARGGARDARRPTPSIGLDGVRDAGPARRVGRNSGVAEYGSSGGPLASS